jgi:CRP/FNR family transcriptional regulator, cyclic AMP receptor protein
MEDLPKKAEVLKKVEFFQALNGSELDKILSVVQRHRFSAGASIFREGDEGDRFYIILLGEVRISKFVPRAGEEALAVLKPGDFFGEMALIDGAPRSAYAIANSDATLLGIERTAFLDLLQQDKELAYSVLSAFCQTLSFRLREMNSKLQALYAFSG